jgi:hypothetical protein
MVLQNVDKGRDIRENITFEVSTGSPVETLNDGGTAKVLFLAGSHDPETTSLPTSPNDHARFLKASFWAETVAYNVVVPIHDERHRPFETHNAEEFHRLGLCLYCHAAIEAAVPVEDNDILGIQIDPVLANLLSELLRSFLAARQRYYYMPKESSTIHDDFLGTLAWIRVTITIIMATRLGHLLLRDMAIHSR